MQATSKQYRLQPTIKPNNSFPDKRRKTMSRNKNQNQKPNIHLQLPKNKLIMINWRGISFGETEADLIVDATWCERAFLPRVKNDELYSTIQFLERHKIEESLFVYMRRTDYAWES